MKRQRLSNPDSGAPAEDGSRRAVQRASAVPLPDEPAPEAVVVIGSQDDDVLIVSELPASSAHAANARRTHVADASRLAPVTTTDAAPRTGAAANGNTATGAGGSRGRRSSAAATSRSTIVVDLSLDDDEEEDDLDDATINAPNNSRYRGPAGTGYHGPGAAGPSAAPRSAAIPSLHRRGSGSVRHAAPGAAAAVNPFARTGRGQGPAQEQQEHSVGSPVRDDDGGEVGDDALDEVPLGAPTQQYQPAPSSSLQGGSGAAGRGASLFVYPDDTPEMQEQKLEALGRQQQHQQRFDQQQQQRGSRPGQQPPGAGVPGGGPAGGGAAAGPGGGSGLLRHLNSGGWGSQQPPQQQHGRAGQQEGTPFGSHGQAAAGTTAAGRAGPGPGSGPSRPFGALAGILEPGGGGGGIGAHTPAGTAAAAAGDSAYNPYTVPGVSPSPGYPFGYQQAHAQRQEGPGAGLRHGGPGFDRGGACGRGPGASEGGDWGRSNSRGGVSHVTDTFAGRGGSGGGAGTSTTHVSNTVVQQGSVAGSYGGGGGRAGGGAGPRTTMDADEVSGPQLTAEQVRVLGLRLRVGDAPGGIVALSVKRESCLGTKGKEMRRQWKWL